MNVPCRMELRHEQGIHVPELGFHERAPHFLESHAHELGLDRIEKFAIGMPFPGAIRGARRLIVYFRNRFVRQLPSFNSSGVNCETSSATPCLRQLFRPASTPSADKLECSGHPIIDPERFSWHCRVSRQSSNDLPLGFREAAAVHAATPCSCCSKPRIVSAVGLGGRSIRYSHLE